MLYLIPPAIGTLALILMEVFLMKRKNSPWYYIRYFLVMSAINVVFHFSEAEAHQNKYQNIAGYQSCALPHVSLDDFDYDLAYYQYLTEHQADYYEQLRVMHMLKGQECFNDAERICVLIPNANDREIAKDLFRMALSISLGKLSFVVTVATLLEQLGEYGFSVYERYQEMEALLLESKYHFEMMDFYQNLLDNSCR